MKIPEDFLEALRKHKKALAFFKTLDRKNLYSIYYQLATPKKAETRTRLMLKIIDQLAREERFS